MRFDIANNHVCVADNPHNFFITTDRRLQRFLYSKEVVYDISFRNEVGITNWAYIRTSYLNALLDVYRQMSTDDRNTYLSAAYGSV